MYLFDQPGTEYLQEFIGIMEVLAHKCIWVHCAVNARVSASMFHYLTKIKGFSTAEASSPLLIKWQPRMDDVWSQFLGLGTQDIGL